MKQTVIIFLILIVHTTLSLSVNYTGRIFVDRNSNGIYDKGERLLSDIPVSDGLNVVRTDKNGEYSLPGHSRERFIFITTPSGYKTQNGYYRKIESELQKYDFGLQVYNSNISKNREHSFIQISDSEISNVEDHEEWVGNIRRYAKNESISFIIHTGDICYEAGLKSHIRLMNSGNMQVPVYYCIGNHDLVKGKYGEELFESIYGPVYYSFDVGNVHYIVTPMLHGDYKPGYTKEDVYRWLKNDLANTPAYKSVVIFNHDLLTYSENFIYGINDTENIDLGKHNLKAWIFGHWHINYIKKQGDVLAISTAAPDKGGIDHSISVFRVVHIDSKDRIRTELRYPYIDKSLTITSISNNQPTYLLSGDIQLSVNAYFSESPVKEVTYTCLVESKQMKKHHMQRQTDWNWVDHFSLPAQFVGKEILVTVQALFKNGDVAETTESFVYKKEKLPAIKLNGNWNNLLGNSQHSGIASDSLSIPLYPSWITNVKANIFMTSPLIYNGNVYIASVDENLLGEAHIYALSAVDGSIKWKQKVQNSIKNTIAADNGHVFAQDAEGYLYAVDAVTGKLVWEKRLNTNELPSLVEGLVAAEGIVYAGTGAGLCASDAKTGKTLWINSGWTQREGATTTLSLKENVLVSGSQWQGLFGNDATNGKMLWSNNKNGLSDRGASAAIHGNRIYITSRSSLFILDTFSGKIIVRKELPIKVDVTSTPLLTDNEIIFGTSHSGLIALDRETLELKWQFETEESLVCTAPYTRKPSATIETSPVLSGQIVYFGASDGVLYGVSKESGNCVWKHKAGSPVFGSVAISGNGLFAVDFAGNVYGFASH